MADTGTAPEELRDIALDRIRPRPNQSRRSFDPEAMQQLADSIRAHGVVQPVVVRPVVDDAVEFELLAGERRWRAAKMAGLAAIPSIVRVGLSEEDALAIHLIENLQRADLLLMEESAGCSSLVEIWQHRLAEIPDREDRTALDMAAHELGVSKAWVSRRCGITGMDPKVQALISDGHVTSVDIAHLLNDILALDPERFEDLADRVSGKHNWEGPPTRRELEEDVKQLKAMAAREKKEAEARAKEEAKRLKAAEKEAKKSGKTVEEVLAAKPEPPPRNESSWERERREQKELARKLAPPLRKFAREQRKALLAAVPPPSKERLEEGYDRWFTFNIGIPDHDIRANTPKDPAKVEYRVEVRGDTRDAGALIEALDPAYRVGLSVRVTIPQLRKIEAILAEDKNFADEEDGEIGRGIRNVEVLHVKGEALTGALAKLGAPAPAAIDATSGDAVAQTSATKATKKSATKGVGIKSKPVAKKAKAKAAKKKKA